MVSHPQYLGQEAGKCAQCQGPLRNFTSRQVRHQSAPLWWRHPCRLIQKLKVIWCFDKGGSIPQKNLVEKVSAEILVWQKKSASTRQWFAEIAKWLETPCNFLVGKKKSHDHPQFFLDHKLANEKSTSPNFPNCVSPPQSLSSIKGLRGFRHGTK